MTKDESDTTPAPGARPPHLSDATAEDILRYVSYVLDRIRLSDWTVLLDDNSCEVADDGPDVAASMHPTSGRRIAILRVMEDWDEQTITRRTQNLIHEVVHLTHRDIWDTWWQLIDESGYVPPSATKVLNGIAVQQYEQMVDKWAEALMELIDPFPGPLTSPTPNVRHFSDDPLAPKTARRTMTRRA